MCCAPGMCPKDTPFFGKILLSPFGWMTPALFFNPTIETPPPPLFQKSTYGPVCPPPVFFLKILRDSQVPQLENLGAKSLCLCPHTCAYFHSCTSPFSHGFPFCIFTHIGIPPSLVYMKSRRTPGHVRRFKQHVRRFSLKRRT